MRNIQQTMTGRKQAKIEAEQVLPEWLMFPALTAAWAKSPEKTITGMSERAAAFKSRSSSGSAAERMRARLITIAYQRVQSLLEELRAVQTALQDGSQE